MKKKIFTLLLVMSALVVNAQSIKLFNGDLPMNNNDTVFIPVGSHGDEVNTYIGYQNLTNTDIEVRVRKEVIFMSEMADLSFCLGECYTGNLSAPLTIPANAMVASSQEEALHIIYAGSSEAALAKFTIFRTDDESDKVSVYVAFGTGSGVRDEDVVKALRAYPNPAVRNVTIDYVSPNNHSYLVIKNLTGKEVYRVSVGKAGCKQVDLSSFTPGFYFYGIESDGKMFCTKKLLVK